MAIEVFDIETNAKDLSTLIHCISLKRYGSNKIADLYFDEHPDVTVKATGTLKQGLERLFAAEQVVGHNIVMFDNPTLYMLAEKYGVTYKQFDPRNVFDTVLASRLIYSEETTLPSFQKRCYASAGPHSLEAWGFHFGRPKVEHDDWERISNNMLVRCQGDVEITYMILEHMLDKCKNYGECVLLEHQVADIIMRQIWGGVKVNVDALQELAVSLSTGYDEALKELREVFPPEEEVMKTPDYYFIPETKFKGSTKGEVQDQVRKAGLKPLKPWFNRIEPGPMRVKILPFEPTADQFAQALIKYRGWKPEVFTDGGKPAVNKDTLPTIPYPEVSLYEECSKCKKISGDMITGKQSVLGNLRETERLHPNLITNGAFTGRMTHQFHIAQISKVKKDADGNLLKGLKGNFGWDCRSVFTARDDWWMVGCDAAGLEMRMLAAFLAPFDGGNLIDIILNGDIHDFMQEMLGTYSRDQTKTAEYLLIYGGGDSLLGTRMQGHPSLTKEMRDSYIGKDTRAEGTRIRNNLMKNVKGMDDLMASLLEQSQQNGNYIFLNDGRPVFVRKEYAILNTLLQGNGAILMKKALVLFWKFMERSKEFTHDEPWRGVHGNWQLLMNTHDEMQTEADSRDKAEFIGEAKKQSIIEAGEQLNYACPMDGSWSVGKNWAETH